MDDSVEQKYVETAHGKIFYFCKHVSDTAPTILFLHGLSSNHTTWNYAMKKLSNLGYNCIAPDLRGHGLSDKTRDRKLCSISQMTSDMEMILQKEKLEKVIVVGYSWGGWIGVDFAIAHPDRVSGLVLVSASHVRPLYFSILSPLVPPYRLLMIIMGYVFWWQKRKTYHYFVHDEVLGYWAGTFVGLSTMPLSVNFWMLAELLKFNRRKDAHKISCPTLLMYGQSDGYITEKEIQDFKKRVKNSEVAFLQDKGHYLGSHHQDLVAERVIEFVRNKIK